MLRSVLPVFAALLVSGCAEEVLKADSSPAFVAGYNDGCATGSAAVDPNAPADAVSKDVNRYNADQDYAVGWQNGFRECDGANLMNNPNDPQEQVDFFGQEGY